MADRISAEEARRMLKALNTAEVPYGNGWKRTDAGHIYTLGNVAIGECWSESVAAIAAAAPTLAATVIALEGERDEARAACVDNAVRWAREVRETRRLLDEAREARDEARVALAPLSALLGPLAGTDASPVDVLHRIDGDLTDAGVERPDGESLRLLSRVGRLIAERDEARARVDQLMVQLGACAAATQTGPEECQPGDYGWSPAYAEVVALRVERDRHATALYTAGFTPCSSAACNCGGWHGGHVEGLRARLRHVAHMLTEHVGAGGPVNAEAAAEKAVGAILGLTEERDRLRALLANSEAVFAGALSPLDRIAQEAADAAKGDP